MSERDGVDQELWEGPCGQQGERGRWVETQDRVLTVHSLKGQGGACCRAGSLQRGGAAVILKEAAVVLQQGGGPESPRPGSVQSREDAGT